MMCHSRRFGAGLNLYRAPLVIVLWRLDQESSAEGFDMLSEEISAIGRGQHLPDAVTKGQLPFVRLVPPLSDPVTGGVLPVEEEYSRTLS